jgi:autophagy-related protein 2
MPDLRPIHDMDRPPWWRRSVRKDFLIFELSDASFRTLIDSRESCKRFEIQCRDISGLFQVSVLQLSDYLRKTTVQASLT